MEQGSRLCGMLRKIPDVSTTMHMQTAAHTKKPEEATIGSPCLAPPRPAVGAGAGAMEGKELNDEQFRAVRHPAGEPLMILAGAGSGKTKTLISRIQFLHSEGIALHRITLHCTRAVVGGPARDVCSARADVMYMRAALTVVGVLAPLVALGDGAVGLVLALAEGERTPRHDAHKRRQRRRAYHCARQLRRRSRSSTPRSPAGST